MPERTTDSAPLPGWLLLALGILGRAIIGLFSLSMAILFGWMTYALVTAKGQVQVEGWLHWILSEACASAAIFMGSMALGMAWGDGRRVRTFASSAGIAVMIIWGGSAFLGVVVSFR